MFCIFRFLSLTQKYPAIEKVLATVQARDLLSCTLFPAPHLMFLKNSNWGLIEQQSSGWGVCLAYN